MIQDSDYNAVIPSHVPRTLVYDHHMRDYQTRDPFVAAHELVNGPVPEIFWTRHLGGHWIVKGAAAINELDRTKTAFSVERMFVPDNQNPEPPYAFVPVQNDPPLHTTVRRVLNPLFAPKRIELLRTKMIEVSNAMIDSIAKTPDCEFVRDYAAEFPVMVFLDLTDLPREDRFRLRDITRRFNNDAASETTRTAPLKDLLDYIRPIVDDRIANPRSDVLSEVLTQGLKEGLTREVAYMLCATILFGGLDTVSASLTFLALFLAQDPVSRRRLIEEPEAIPRAVEEVLRRYSIISIGRNLKSDIVFRGINMRAGDHIMWSASMHNLDEHVYPQAMTVDFDRKRPMHNTFGGSIHFCPGAALARTEMRIFTETWLKRFQDFRVASDKPLRYRNGHHITLRELPLVIQATT